MKTCTKCGVQRPKSEFYRDKSQPDGLCSQCKECRRKWREQNEGYSREYYSQNRADLLEQKREYHVKNRERRREYHHSYWERTRDLRHKQQRAYYRAHKPEYFAWARLRKEYVARATPLWADKRAITEFYRKAAEQSERFGRKVHVDHIYPLRGKNVCGLHVPENLQLMFAEDNLSKSNRFEAA